MKKIFVILVVMVFSSYFILAQNTSTTSQTGNNNDINISQDGGLQDADVSQEGNTNTTKINQFTDNGGTQISDVIQTGNTNNAEVDMDQTGSGGNTPGNSAYIEQIGNNNDSYQRVNAPSSNSGQDVMGTQTGNSNELDQRILGGYTDYFEAAQTGNNNKIVQLMPSATHNKGVVNQDGNNNDANQNLSGGNNGYNAPISVTQDGDWNTTDQDFVSTQTFSHVNNGKITQTGNYNYGKQDVTGANVTVQSEVIGNNNDSRQFVGSYGDESYIVAIGNLNVLKTDQHGDYNFSDVKLNEVGIGTSNSNDVNVKQTGDYNHFELGIGRGDIGADNNKVDADHSGNGHYHRVSVDGSNNDIKINASGNVGGSQYAGNRGDWDFKVSTPWNSTSDNNSFVLKQTGMNNAGTGKVAGDNNDIDLTQTGNDNLIGTDWYTNDGVVIEGNNNMVKVRQLSNDNSSMNTITGNGNTVNVLQQ
jgi:Curlin associated repeat